MNLLDYLILATIVALITIVFSRNKKYIRSKLLILLTGFTIALIILILPLYKEYNLISQIVFSILYSLQVIFLGQDFELINMIELNNIVNTVYVVAIYILFLLEPLITATAILTFLGNNLSKIRLMLSRFKEILIFSEINEKTLTIARKQYNKKKMQILFVDDKENKEKFKKEISQLKAIILNQQITDLNFKNRIVTYYLFSEYEEENLNNALKLLKQGNNKKKRIRKVYVLNNSEEARIILDSASKNNIKLELINEKDRAIYQHIYDEPLYKNSINNQISILIVGCGKLGTEFLKGITWCGQVINHKLNINIIDINANKIKDALNIKCPELVNEYNYNFIEADIYSEKAIMELDKLKNQNINYVMVALDSETKNIDVAILLRRYFLQQDNNTYSRMPSINLWIEKNDKKAQIDSLKHDSIINSYNLNSFGSIDEMYNTKSIVNSEIEQLAMQVHGVYNPEDINKNLEDFYKLEYNKKSSRAVGVHIKYKLYSILKDKYSGNLENDLENNISEVLKQFNQIKDDKILNELAKNEHDRWNAYVRTDGFKNIAKEEVLKYKDFTQNTKHFLAKLHPAIVEYEKLEEVENYLQKDFKSADINIISNIEKILNKEIYK
ncbi:MAG: hypothetical protein IKL55_06260 [Clostridia bacterium]|nr:hypothetical protein [Clostridia bacterium]